MSHDFNGLNNNPIFSANISQTLIILPMAYNVGATNVTSSAYPKDPANILDRHGSLSLVYI